MNTLHPSQLANADAARILDELAEEILNASDRIFPLAAPVDSSQATFTLTERALRKDAGSDSVPVEVIVCPKARLRDSTTEKPKVFRCRCCCVGEPHTDNLTYKLIKGKSLLIEELHPDGQRRWFIMAVKPGPSTLVIVRLSDVSPIYYKEVEAVSKNIRPQGISPKRVLGMTSFPRTVPMIQNDWGFPSAKIAKVILHSSNTTILLQTPLRIQLKHCGILQSPYVENGVNQGAHTSLSPQSYFCILSKGSHSDEDAWEVRDTQISHETNPLGRLVVTLQNTTVSHAIVRGKQGAEVDVDFYFDLREDAQLFKAYLEAGQKRLRQFFIRGLMENEQVVGLRLLDSDSSPREDVEIKDKTPQISQRGLLKCLNDLEIWISDYDQSGKSIVSRMSWEELSLRGTKSGSFRATFIKSENERTAGDWLDEVDDLIRTMRGDRNDRYERVKIAIIDSGLHDRERSHYGAEYKDFTGVPNNDSWHGTCCAGIIQGMYEEARLYVARVFERDHAYDIEGPLRMARAIHWAIEPPNSVDIISISAGFRNYSKELDEAVTRAKAAGVLVIAAASNWQNTNTVAFPARHNLSTMCIYSTNTGNQSSSFNPEPRADTQNFAIIGEGFQHPDQRRNERMSGTSMATAVAAGLAARIVDFSRQKDNKASIFRAQDVGKLPGMLSIFSTISKPAGNLRYISPLELLPLRHGVSREADRQRVREVLSQAMERAN
ncbi:uncharacterized protein FTJAE_13381 [Fusarium tjaetaba]|uniref:Peptidase S8/S53 domain-containing protein n=1 Tax=Fusarium tjaetaba TaxID=1567544 RepID=A0A8H5QKF5_9HYPO|nr:uncharacterized protein FTJAE_13381 [Fusarium tjaetaba]KAF5615396.1 hypothetical protein FTJAE_13381 [Fusarium tjaetaba]